MRQHSPAGFREGVYETTGASILGSDLASDKTNEFVLAAAYYAITHLSPPPPPSNPVSNMGPYVMNAAPGTAWFLLPDYNGAFHTPASKCGGIIPAELSDYSAGGYLLGLLLNPPQNQVLDANSEISKSPCGEPGIGIGTIVTLAGPIVNEVVHYYESVEKTSPLYFRYSGANSFVVRSTGKSYSFGTKSRADYFAIQAFTDQADRKVFMFYGFSWEGTLASGQFFASYVYPQMSQFSNSWYIFLWQDAASGSSHNSFPDPADSYTLVASSGEVWSIGGGLGSPNPGTSASGFGQIGNDVFQAYEGNVYFVLPDYTATYHSSAAKCFGNAAALSDYSAGGYLLSVLATPQNEVLDTSSSLSKTSGSCGKFVGSSSVVVGVAGPLVNTMVHYYEKVSATSPVFFSPQGGVNAFQVRATGTPYILNSGPGDDYFLLEYIADGSRHVYIIYGFSWEGTLAGATYVNTYVRPNPSGFTNNWYIYEWKDATSGASANSFPDSGDQYIPIAPTSP